MLARQLKRWALAERRPWFHLLAETCRDFLPPTVGSAASSQTPAPWIRPEFAALHRRQILGYPDRITPFHSPPSFQYNLQAVEALRRSLAWSPLSPTMPREKRYPYLDRTLLEFLFAVPREQLVRPGERRSLMRRALQGIVPNEIIERRRKAYVSRAPRNALVGEWNAITSQNFVSSDLGLVDASRLRKELENAKLGRDVSLVPLVRAVSLECWLRHLSAQIPVFAVQAQSANLQHFSAERLSTERR